MKMRSCVFLTVFFCFLPIAHAQDLLEIYRLAVENDPVLKQAYENRLAVGESKDQSIALLLPKISISAGSSRNWLNNTKRFSASNIVSGSGKQTYWDNQFSLNLTQPVFNWSSWIQLSQSDNLIARAEAQYQAEQQNLMVKTADAYFNVLTAEDNLEFRLAEKASIARQLEQAQQRFEVGLIAITDVYEAQAGFDQARADVIAAENQVDNAKEALREIIGSFAGELAKLSENLPLLKPQPNDIDNWSKNAATQNLNIVASFNQAEAARKTISLQRSGHYPTLDIVGSYGERDNTASFGFRGDNQSIGLQLNVPLYEGGAINSRTRQAQHEYDQAHDALIATQRAVQRQVKDAYRGVISSISRVEALKAAVVSGESSLEATEAGFEVGTRTMVDVLATTRNLFDAKTKYSRSRYDYLINHIKLKQAASILTQNDLIAINGFLK